MAVPAAIRQPAPHSALRRLVAAFLAMVYVVGSAVALVPVLAAIRLSSIATGSIEGREITDG